MNISYVVGVAMSLAACSTPLSNPVSSAPAAAALNISSASLYKAITSIPSAQTDAAFDSLKRLPVNAYYSLEEHLAGSRQVSIDGQPVVNRISTAAQQAQIQSLNTQFSSIGAYWSSIGVTGAPVSEVQFTQGLRSLLGGVSPSLALAGDSNQVKVVKTNCDLTRLTGPASAAFDGQKVDESMVAAWIATMQDTAQKDINSSGDDGSSAEPTYESLKSLDAYAYMNDLQGDNEIGGLTIIPYGPYDADETKKAADFAATLKSECLSSLGG